MTQLRIRMYRPGGLGDCFLLSLPKDKKGEQMAHILIDCGVLRGTEDAAERMRAIVEDILEETGKRLDLLVVTHEHWDHVSGFLQVQPAFQKLAIETVWLAWTEGPADEVAQKLRKIRERAARALTKAQMRLAALPAGLDDADMRAANQSREALAKLDEFFGVFGAKGGSGTADAMAWVREGTGAKVCYLKPGEEPQTIAGVEGVRVFVLGPPRDTKLLKRSDPSKAQPEVYALASGMDFGFAALLGGSEEGDADDIDNGRPFDRTFERSSAEARTAEFFKSSYFASNTWRQIEIDWLGTAERLALQLDSDTNNTSLALAIELVDSGRTLIFPGDAQIGNWLSWESYTWSVKDRNGATVQVKASDLLARAVLYKVGHHASHNATLKAKGLELMQSPDLVALITVYENQARKQGRQGWNMPFDPLLCALKEKTTERVIRTDTGAPEFLLTDGSARCTQTELYIDYLVDL